MNIKSTLLTLALVLMFINAFAAKYPKREMRAVWIASVANIDWPSRAGLAVDMQQEEMIELLDLAKAYHMNTVVFQIRPATDAMYWSRLEPWSQWLNGEQGKAPDPFYDPLQFTIDECRKRGLDIHVWMNPYRAVFDTARSSVSDDHPIKNHPEWFVKYGKTAYFNPGLPETRAHVSSIVADVIRRYDVDAVHFDDYFYPYRIAGKEFPDQDAFELYPRSYQAKEKEDWRRDNVDLIIKQLHDTIKSIAPHVEFGISPFGVWRNASKDPRGSATKAGQTNYDDLYADVLMWQEKGWVDYVCPQIYWHIGKEVADYKIIAQWWNANAFDCPLYIGHAFYRLKADSNYKEWQSAKEIEKQIKLNRKLESVGGSMFFSAKFMRTNPLGLKEQIQKKQYRYLALPPTNKRIAQLDAQKPVNTSLSLLNDQIKLEWEADETSKAFVIYKLKKGKALKLNDVRKIIAVTGEKELLLDISKETDPSKHTYVISSLSITNQESNPVVFE